MSAPRVSTRSFRGSLFALLIGLFALLPARAQERPVSFVMVGGGAAPNLGGIAEYVRPGWLGTIEGALYSTFRPAWGDDKPAWFVGAGVGASFRLKELLVFFGPDRYPGYEMEVGVRIGPKLRFTLRDESLEEKNTRFSLFAEPFLRLRGPFGERNAFIEIGPQDPSLRLGVVFD